MSRLGPLALVALVALPATLGCLGDADDPVSAFPGRTGRVSFERFVAIGDGYVAGVTDAALFESGQAASVPALVAERAGAPDFVQPDVADPGFAVDGSGGGRLVLVEAFPPVVDRLPRGGPPLEGGLARPYNNLAVPGALLAEVETAQSSATSIGGNPFYDLVLRGRGTTAEQVAELDATFALIWFGTTDVLDFAEAGGDPALAPGLPTTPAAFALAFERLLDEVLAVTSRVVVLNVFDVTALPAFTTVPPVAIDPETGRPFTITVIEEVVDPVTGDTLTVRRDVPVPLLGPDGPLDATDRVLLDATPLLDAGIGVPAQQGGTDEPLPDAVVLDRNEQALARDVVFGYNASIDAIAAERDVPVVDVRGFVEALGRDGVVTDGVLLTPTYVTGQAFGLDGVHFTPKAYGAIANLVLDVLNDRFGADLPAVRTSTLPGVAVDEVP